MFFILSTGRSGTMTIAKTLSLIDGCVCLHEPSPELILEASAYHYGKYPKEDLIRILTDTRKPEINGSIYCESNQNLSLIIPVLAEVFPEARYIWLVRNGLDVVASAFQKQWYSGRSAKNKRYEDCSPLEKAWIDGRVEGDRCGEMTPDEWAKLDRFSRCCWYWGYINRVIENDLKTYAHDKYFFLRLEDINEQMPDLIDWMGLKVMKAPAVRQHNIAKRIPYHWTGWNDGEMKSFDKWGGDLMDKYYPSWRNYTDREGNIYFTQYLNVLKYKIENPPGIDKLQKEITVLKTEMDQIKKSWSWKILSLSKKILKSVKKKK
jgi:hypothetical protein